jgi:hypothetical protein
VAACRGDAVLLPETLVAAALNSRDGNGGWQPMFGNGSTEARGGDWLFLVA